MQLWQRFQTYRQYYYKKWLDRRIPPAKRVVLNQRNLFIIPSKAGLGFLVLIVLLWLLATNFENNLIFLLCFLLIGLFVVAIHITHANLSGITVRQVKAQSVFAGQKSAVTIALTQKSAKTRDAIILHFDDGDPQVVSLTKSGDYFVNLLLSTHKRGYLQPGRLCIESYYPFGILRVWSHIQLSFDAVVYPKPVEGIQQATSGGSDKEGSYDGQQGSDDYVGLKRYQQGESLNHIAWKHYARGQGLWSKLYADPVNQQHMIDWDSFPGMHREYRLSCMSFLVKQYSEGESSFGLKLPSLEVPPNRGAEHSQLCLRHLALFEIAPLEVNDAS